MANQLADSAASSNNLQVLPTPILATATSSTPFWKQKRFVAVVAMLALYIIWGTTLSAMHFGIQSIPPAEFAFLRYFLSALILIAFCKSRQERWPTREELKHHAIAGICLFTAGNAIAIWAVKYIPTVLAGALMATTPFWMIGLAAMQPPKEKLHQPVVMGMILGFIGIITILAPQFVQEFVSKNAAAHFGMMEWLSVLGMLSTTVFWAYGSLYTKKHPSQNSMFMTIAFQNLAASIVILPFIIPGLLSGSLAHVTAPSFWALMYLIFIATIIAVPCYFYSLKNLPISLASTFAYVSPIITMVVGHIFLKEALSSTMSIGACLVLSGVILVQGFQQRSTVKLEPTPLKPTPFEKEAA